MGKTIFEEYRQTLDFLFRQLPMFQRVGAAAFKKDLTNIRALCTELGTPQTRFPAIHIAGTNGKGSTTHLIGGVLMAQGLKVGFYTSPHYRDFRERIKINGKLISRRAVVAFVKNHKLLFSKIKPSFFEITVALAFDYFARQKVDIAIIETGLGGRLDSTNIIQPLLSVITNIDYDHQQFLGDTLPEIAGEKAGIIKPDTPVVIGEIHSETRPVFEQKARTMNAPISFAQEYLQVTHAQPLPPHHTSFDILGKNDQWKELVVNVRAAYQQKNLLTALHALEVFRGVMPGHFLPLKEEKIRAGLKNFKSITHFLGRWQQLGDHPLVICDSGHNEAGIREILYQLEQTAFQQLHFVLGMVKDKEVEKILKLLPAEARYYFVKAQIPRAMPADVLREKARAFGLSGRSYSSVKNGLRAAKRAAGAGDLVFVGGSTFVVAEVVR